jgi:branched-chain amino acid aminotransferase
MIINLNGKIVPESEAKISVLDHGLLYGASIYETLRTYRGKPFLLDSHLGRLQESAQGIYLKLPISIRQIRKELQRTLEAARYPESYVRMIVTRGGGELSYDPSLCKNPNFIILAKELSPPPAELYDNGVTVSLVSVRRNLASAVNPSLKTGNLLSNMLAWVEGNRHGAYEALMLNVEGQLTECTMSNIFLLRNQTLMTPAIDCGILPGITRGLVLEVARESGMAALETALFPHDLYQADEAFLTVTSREIIPVVRCDSQTIGSGVPGAVTKLLHAKYRQKVEELMKTKT